MQELFDQYLPGWRDDNATLRRALNIPRHEIWKAHCLAKKQLIDHVNRTTGAGLDVDAFTLGFARRAATYKRADLLIHDIPQLKRVVAKAGPLQVLYAGKAHPADESGKALIQRIVQARQDTRGCAGSRASAALPARAAVATGGYGG